MNDSKAFFAFQKLCYCLNIQNNLKSAAFQNENKYSRCQ